MSFLEELGKKASETCKNTAEKTNKLTKEMKIKSMISDNKNKIEKLYNEIGKKVYDNLSIIEDKYKKSINDECEKIDVLSKEIENMNMELLALKDMKKCSNCYAEISLKARFCSACGCPQENNEPENTQSTEIAVIENENIENNENSENVVETNQENNNI